MWVGRVRGARAILRIGGEKDAYVVQEHGGEGTEPDECVYYLDYFALLLDSEYPQPTIYTLYEFSVADDGSFILELMALRTDVSPRMVEVSGTVDHGNLRIECDLGEDGALPSRFVLKRSMGKASDDEARLRKFLERSIRRHLGIEEGAGR